jgi:hypothetical protein
MYYSLKCNIYSCPYFFTRCSAVHGYHVVHINCAETVSLYVYVTFLCVNAMLIFMYYMYNSLKGLLKIKICSLKCWSCWAVCTAFSANMWALPVSCREYTVLYVFFVYCFIIKYLVIQLLPAYLLSRECVYQVVAQQRVYMSQYIMVAYMYRYLCTVNVWVLSVVCKKYVIIYYIVCCMFIACVMWYWFFVVVLTYVRVACVCVDINSCWTSSVVMVLMCVGIMNILCGWFHLWGEGWGCVLLFGVQFVQGLKYGVVSMYVSFVCSLYLLIL